MHRAPPPLAPTRSGRRKTPRHGTIKVTLADGTVQERSPYSFAKARKAAPPAPGSQPKPGKAVKGCTKAQWLEIRRLCELRGIDRPLKPRTAWEAQKILVALRRELSAQRVGPLHKGKESGQA